jgi:hypothetical protein
MNPKTLIYCTDAERLIVDAVLALEQVNTLQELIMLSEACCDLHGVTFSGEVGEA